MDKFYRKTKTNSNTTGSQQKKAAGQSPARRLPGSAAGRQNTAKKQDDTPRPQSSPRPNGSNPSANNRRASLQNNGTSRFNTTTQRKGLSQAARKGMTIVLLLFLELSFMAVALSFYITSPIDSASIEQIDVVVEDGMQTASIAQLLKDCGLIRSAQSFKFFTKVSGKEASLRSGQYKMSKSMAMGELADLLVAGSNKAQIEIQILEGWDMSRISKHLGETCEFSAEEFLEEANGNFTYYQKKYRFLFGVPAAREDKLEGYLFGDTYKVFVDATPRQVIEKMLDRFDEIFLDNYFERALQLGYTIDEIVTIASIVEREGILDSELKSIASVFYNRLGSEDYPKLQSCATIQYIYKEYRFSFTNKELEIDNPYNTYIYPGLPPGPISNFRKTALEAALYPDTTGYYFFLSKNDGTESSVFAETYAQHQKNIREFLD
ncbi:MAG: endolytic transglycosylase MltG [Eubacteriaceae bacterium]|nr:endolytic transglycosylase MltG [Eubacteriaceae bacterium]